MSESNLHYAGMPRRYLAGFIDGVVILLLFALIFLYINSNFVAKTAFFNNLEIQPWIFLLGIGIVDLIYDVLFIHFFGGTLGKLVLGLRVINTTGGKVSLQKAILRETIGRVISGFGNIGYLSIAFDPRKQGFHDKLAGTFIIKV